MPLENKQWTNSHFNRPFQFLKMLKQLKMLGDFLYNTKILQWNYVPSSTPGKIHLVLQLNAKQRLEKKIEKKSENTKSYWARGLRVLQYIGQPTLRPSPSFPYST